MSDKPVLKKSDFQSDQAIRWCPGCGDYAILAQTQKIFPEITEKKEDTVFISGIGCSSRFPYYMNTYGCLLYTSPSPRDKRQSRMPSSA